MMSRLSIVGESVSGTAAVAAGLPTAEAESDWPMNETLKLSEYRICVEQY